MKNSDSAVKKREKAAVSMAVAAAAALADVLITEFLISNISQKRGEGGNENGREERRGLYPMGREEGMEGADMVGAAAEVIKFVHLFFFCES